MTRSSASAPGLRKRRGAGWETGYVHVYTGDGKGKTTAALGLAVRAAGAGLKVFIGQFVKGRWYSELAALRRLGRRVTVRQYGRRCFIRGKPTSRDVAAARRGLADVSRVLAAGKHRLVILDEANIAVHYALFSAAELVETIRSRHASVEVVVTGRRAAPELLALADLVTDMREVKHYYRRGVKARTGIEA